MSVLFTARDSNEASATSVLILSRYAYSKAHKLGYVIFDISMLCVLWLTNHVVSSLQEVSRSFIEGLHCGETQRFRKLIQAGKRIETEMKYLLQLDEVYKPGEILPCRSDPGTELTGDDNIVLQGNVN
jgi:hypothetical protein